MLKSRIRNMAIIATMITGATGFMALTGSGASAAVTSAHARTAAPAIAAATSADPDFTCPDSSVCVFQDLGWSGNPVGVFPTAAYSEQWTNLVSSAGLALPWGSFNNNSGSSVVFGDAQTKTVACYLPHARISEPPVVTHYRYMWIEFGNTTCTGYVGPLPNS
jgi:hypothetical protein